MGDTVRLQFATCTKNKRTKGGELLERRGREIDVVVASGVAAVDNANLDSLAVPGKVGSLATGLAVVGVSVCVALECYLKQISGWVVSYRSSSLGTNWFRRRRPTRSLAVYIL